MQFSYICLSITYSIPKWYWNSFQIKNIYWKKWEKGLSENGYHSLIFDKKFYYLVRWDSGKSVDSHSLFFFSDNGSGSGEGGKFQIPLKRHFLLLHFKNGFTEIKFTYHTICPLKVYNSVAFSVLTELYINHHSQL